MDETHVVIRKEYLDDVNEILQEEVRFPGSQIQDDRN